MINFLKINEMKIYRMLCVLMITVLSISHVSAQIASNPYVNGATVNPAPLPVPSNGASVYFLFGNSTTTPIALNPLNVINVSLSKLAVNGAFSAATNITIANGDYFTFTYNTVTNTLTATQKAVIPGNSTQIVTLTGLQVTGQSDINNPQNGLNVNVAFLGSVNPNQVDDNTSAFTYTSTGGSLPIRLLSFDGMKEVNKVLLKWQTTSEQNSKYFDVEFSDNGNVWNSIGKVNAAGNSSTQRAYSLFHNNPVNGTNYYRLKQVDINGNYSYSNIVAIKFTIKGININAVYPNPFVSQIKIEVSSDIDEIVRIRLLDNVGRVLKTQTSSIQKGVNNIWVNNLSGLASGIYTVQVKTAYNTFQYKLKK